MSALSIALLLLAAEPRTITLDALVPTSGNDADLVLDGKADTGWTPSGDVTSEGILFRFAAPIDAQEINVVLCKGAQDVKVTGYRNGYKNSAVVIPGKGKLVGSSSLSTYFLRVDSGKNVCIAEVKFGTEAQALAVRAPRRVSGTIAVSSTLAPIDAYHAGFLFDGRTDFGWVEGVKGPGIGQSVTLTFNEPTPLTGLELWNGYQRSQDHFKKNARAKKIAVSLDGAEPQRFDVKDAMGPQQLLLAKPATAKVVKLTIESAYPGKSYDDLVLSELRFLDTDGPKTLASEDLAQRTAAMQGEVKGKGLAKIVDRELHPLCDRDSDQRVKLRTNHTFVAYVDHSEQATTVNEVIEGAWVIKDQKAPWATMELFARRHMTNTTPQEYGDGVYEETGITGGKLKIATFRDLGQAGVDDVIARWEEGPAKDRASCLDPKTFDAQAAQGALIIEGPALTMLLVP